MGPCGFASREPIARRYEVLSHLGFSRGLLFPTLSLGLLLARLESEHHHADIYPFFVSRFFETSAA
jgi:hypothetical protein